MQALIRRLYIRKAFHQVGKTPNLLGYYFNCAVVVHSVGILLWKTAFWNFLGFFFLSQATLLFNLMLFSVTFALPISPRKILSSIKPKPKVICEYEQQNQNNKFIFYELWMLKFLTCVYLKANSIFIASLLLEHYWQTSFFLHHHYLIIL